jgi:hypothetical protein
MCRIKKIKKPNKERREKKEKKMGDKKEQLAQNPGKPVEHELLSKRNKYVKDL